MRKRIVLIVIAVMAFSSAFAAVDPTDPLWQTFVAGQIKDIPDPEIKRFLLDSHHKNPYAEHLSKELAGLGPFSPSLDNIFWLPTIDMPLNPSAWRFLSEIADAPAHLIHLCIVQRDGISYVRMFLHPYSTKQPAFIEMAKKNGGFKYEFQAATTASVRSLIAWKVNHPRSAPAPGVDFPENPDRLLHVKVSIYGTNIEGSRLNPAKKMVRAATVTRLMSEIPYTAQQELNFGFSGEWIVGVPDGTDAGFVVRELLETYKDNIRGRGVEPGFTSLSPQRLDEISSGQGDRLGAIVDRAYLPVMRVMMYLLFEEGMIGELHTQNYGFERNINGALTKRVVFHDADAFRTSMFLRALNKRSMHALREIDDPFYYMKDGIFFGGQNADGDSYTLNALVDYFIGQNDGSSMVKMVYEWCSALSVVPSWCTRPKIRQRFLEEMSAEISKYLGRSVSWKELDFNGSDPGKVGFIKLFNERLDYLASQIKEVSDSRQQFELKREFERLTRRGRARTLGNLNPERTFYSLSDSNGAAAILAITRDPGPGEHVVKGVAVLGSQDDYVTRNFLKRVDSRLVKECTGAREQARIENGVFPKLPLFRNMGGGINVMN